MSSLISDFTIGGFKAFGPEQSVSLRPITLIFGPNSSGKSSLLHSLLWANHAQRTGAFHAEQVVLSGEKVDLGNFNNLVYRHEPLKAVKLGFRYEERYQVNLVISNEAIPVDGQTRTQLQPRIIELVVFKEESVLIRALRRPDDKLHFEPGDLNHHDWQEVISTYYNDELDRIPAEAAPYRAEAARMIETLLKNNPSDSSKLPGLWNKITERAVLSCVKSIPDALLNYDEIESDNFEQFAWYLNQMIERPLSLVSQFLYTLSYLGPLRSLPERDDFRRDRSRWVAGNECWDTLLNDEHVRGAVNDFFGQKFRFKPYKFVRKSFFGDGEQIDDLVLTDLQTNTQVTHRDVGVGISQVVPVLVHAFASKERTILIEQPELHIHPALQAEMGDVFIRSALGDQRNRFILETHSEHLILRLLRRIRQTTENATNGYPEDLPRIKPDDVSILYAKPTVNGTELITLQVTPDGDFVEQWPDGFFTERGRELFA